MDDDPRQRAQQLLAETAHFDRLGLDGLAALARTVARDTLLLCDDLEWAVSAARTAKERHEAYVAYHQAHCFERNGSTKTGAPAEPHRAE